MQPVVNPQFAESCTQRQKNQNLFERNR